MKNLSRNQYRRADKDKLLSEQDEKLLKDYYCKEEDSLQMDLLR